MHNELRLATSDLARFLQETLPELSEDWWTKHVVNRLSFQQQRVIGEKNISALRELDFAALLRILDQNWYDLSGNCSLPREARNWVKELQTVRNKWAHMSAEETPTSAPLPDYNYRHNLSDSLIHQADLLHLQHTSLLMLHLKYRK
jgi:ATP-dependent helicase HepA